MAPPCICTAEIRRIDCVVAGHGWEASRIGVAFAVAALREITRHVTEEPADAGYIASTANAARLHIESADITPILSHGTPEQKAPRCIGNDPSCPCRDGDVCHYVDTPGTRALHVPDGTSRSNVCGCRACSGLPDVLASDQVTSRHAPPVATCLVAAEEACDGMTVDE